jgi:small subunit ribosomal protein S8
VSMHDPIADLLTRIRNAQRAGKPDVSAPASKLKVAIVKVLKDEGYLGDFAITRDGGKSRLDIQLKYYEGRPVIDRLERVSKPGLRIYRATTAIPKILGGMGTVIVSTPKGVMTDAQARAAGQGGEVLCIVS